MEWHSMTPYNIKIPNLLCSTINIENQRFTKIVHEFVHENTSKSGCFSFYKPVCNPTDSDGCTKEAGGNNPRLPTLYRGATFAVRNNVTAKIALFRKLSCASPKGCS